MATREDNKHKPITGVDSSQPAASVRKSAGLTVQAGALAAALKAAKPNVPTKVPCIVLLEANARKKLLQIEEAKHGLFAASIPAKGSLPSGIQVDGKILGKLAVSFPTDAVVELAATDGALEFRVGKFASQLRRVDQSPAKVKPKSMPVDRKHTGKVEPRLEGRHIRQRGQAWGFSANVPFKADGRDGDQEGE